jgi:hypothetical protein
VNPALSLAEIDGAGRVVSEAHIAQTTLNHRGLGWRLEFGGSHKQNLTCNLDKGHARTRSRQSTVRHSANGPTKRDLTPQAQMAGHLETIGRVALRLLVRVEESQPQFRGGGLP